MALHATIRNLPALHKAKNTTEKAIRILKRYATPQAKRFAADLKKAFTSWTR